MIAAAALTLTISAAASCTRASAGSGSPDHAVGAGDSYRLGRLTARVEGRGHGGRAGLQTLRGDGTRGGIIYVPSRYDPARPAPLILLLHGAGGSGARVARSFLPLADSSGAIVIAPDSRGQTWDFIRGPFGPDVAYIDSLLRDTFTRYDVDSARVGIGGFSDGASYALSLGMTNGDLFKRVLALSPGLAGVIEAVGRPTIFIAHGTQDQILNIDRTSRAIVPRLRSAGYQIEYREFAGLHAIDPDILRDAMRWLTGE
jgi:phospholipase/carboxylesterase